MARSLNIRGLNLHSLNVRTLGRELDFGGEEVKPPSPSPTDETWLYSSDGRALYSSDGFGLGYVV